jgi:hypothetical protein
MRCERNVRSWRTVGERISLFANGGRNRLGPSMSKSRLCSITGAERGLPARVATLRRVGREQPARERSTSRELSIARVTLRCHDIRALYRIEWCIDRKSYYSSELCGSHGTWNEPRGHGSHLGPPIRRNANTICTFKSCIRSNMDIGVHPVMSLPRWIIFIL